MTEEKNNKTKKEETKEELKEEIKKTEEKSEEDVSLDAFEEKKEETKKNALGLEELPEEIVKKLEKKKAARDQKHSKKSKKFKKKKAAKNVQTGRAFIKATYNNTIVTLTDMQGNVISWASAGIAGFKGPKKATPYAAQIITRIAVGKAKEDYGLSEVEVFVKGVGTGRESAIRSLNNNGLLVTAIKDVTPVPHNGCRKRKPRRV